MTETLLTGMLNLNTKKPGEPRFQCTSSAFVIEQTHILPIVLVLPRKLCSNITENLLTGMLTNQDFVLNMTFGSSLEQKNKKNKIYMQTKGFEIYLKYTCSQPLRTGVHVSNLHKKYSVCGQQIYRKFWIFTLFQRV